MNQLKSTLDDSVILASEEEWYNEYLDYTIGVKIVKDINEAINHINKFGSGHSEAIVTKSYESFSNIPSKSECSGCIC